MEKLQTISIDNKALKSNGFSNGRLEVILREGKSTHLASDFGTTPIFPKELTNFIPMGNPPAFFSGFSMVEGKAYFSTFKTKNTATHLSLSSDNSKFKHPI